MCEYCVALTLGLVDPVNLVETGEVDPYTLRLCRAVLACVPLSYYGWVLYREDRETEALLAELQADSFVELIGALGGTAEALDDLADQTEKIVVILGEFDLS